MLSLFKRNNEFDIFPLADEHLGLAAELHRQRFLHAWSAGELRKLLGQRPVFGHIMRQASRIVRPPASGFVLARNVGDETEILTLCVDARWARNGIGWRLMVAAMKDAQQHGADHVLLEVDALNEAAVALYHKLGFAEVGRRKAYYAKDDGSRSTALVMRRELG